MGRREENSFRSLLENDNKTIIIPIIQRDYAQGRNDEKAKKVRKRLLDDWISVLRNPAKRMDFNFIYGEETLYGKVPVFFPVDGQQRITSLYLLHWYLAFKTNNETLISKWNFDYKTRNSASEFFSFLKGDTAQDLFNLLNNDRTEKYKSIQNQKWYKSKWENDPTVTSCLSFLIELSDRITECEKKDPDTSKNFWNRISDAENPAIYFTYLPENNANAEIQAARTYTRMNARGKRLTDFENLKAMVDELESRQSTALNISSSFDRVYIDYLFDKNLPLIDATKKINKYGLNWFQLIYYIYNCAFHSQIGLVGYSDLIERYEDEIYQLSQGRKNDPDINEYLKMLKAVLELVCNSSGSIDISSSDLLNSPSRKTIAFVLYAYRKWEKGTDETEQLEKNKTVSLAWKEFSSLLDDLNYENWNSLLVNNIQFAGIILNILKDYKNSQDYFISNDFENNNPFGNWNILCDLNCRVLECKIMWHLIGKGVIAEAEIRAFQNKSYGRIGYLYYLCGYLRTSDTWKTGDWTLVPIPQETKNIKDYIDILSIIFEYLDSNALDFDYCLKAVYAYTSQYDSKNKRLQSSTDINTCNNEHIWKPQNLIWNDDEYNQLKNGKKVQLNHLKNMLDLLRSYTPNNKDEHIKEYYELLKNSLNTGYDDCWLRFALQYPEGGETLLNNRLTVDNNNVNLVIGEKKYDAAIHTYLMSEGYTKKDNVILGTIGSDDKWYCCGDSKQFDFSSYSAECVFSESTGFDHSTNPNYNFETYKRKVRMELSYSITAVINAFNNGKHLTFEKDSAGDIIIRNYKKGSILNGKIEIQTEELHIGLNTITGMNSNMNSWKSRIDTIVAYPDQNKNAINAYDTWLELRSGDNQSVQTTIPSKFSKGTKRKWEWREDYPIQANSKPLPNTAF